jgi:hypothetical protein
MATYVVEHEYEKPLSEEQHNEEARRADPCLAKFGVTWKATYLSGDRLKMLCEFEGDSKDHIVNALRSADVSFVRVWPATKWLAK